MNLGFVCVFANRVHYPTKTKAISKGVLHYAITAYILINYASKQKKLLFNPSSLACFKNALNKMVWIGSRFIMVMRRPIFDIVAIMGFLGKFGPNKPSYKEGLSLFFKKLIFIYMLWYTNSILLQRPEVSDCWTSMSYKAKLALEKVYGEGLLPMVKKKKKNEGTNLILLKVLHRDLQKKSENRRSGKCASARLLFLIWAR